MMGRGSVQLSFSKVALYTAHGAAIRNPAKVYRLCGINRVSACDAAFAQRLAIRTQSTEIRLILGELIGSAASDVGCAQRLAQPER